MTQRRFWQAPKEQSLAKSLQALSAREQISLLVRAMRSLSRRERAEIWRIAGFSVLRDRFLPLLLHVLFKRVLTGTLWWMLCAIASLLVLVLVEQLNPNAVAPVFVGVVSYFGGFFLSGLIDFFRTLAQFFRTTCAHSAREELLLRLNACDDTEKLVLLRMMSASLAHKVPGESLVTALLMGLILFASTGILISLLVLLSGTLPAIGNFPWLLLVAGTAFSLGLFGPALLYHNLFARTTR
jgi:hypothetical protein